MADDLKRLNHAGPSIRPPGITDALRWPRAIIDAWRGETVRLAGRTIRVPGTRRERLSVLAGNLRIHRLLERWVKQGSIVIDVGANIGYNTIHAARLAGPTGRVVALEPTPDTFAVLQHNIAASDLDNIVIKAVAAGRVAGTQDFFVRGATSAVNSLYPESHYAHVTSVLRVPVVRLDDIVAGAADVVKIDVEGAELDVLEGMSRLLDNPGVVLIVEWHPLLQQMAGHGADTLPRWLLDRGWRLQAASHLAVRPLVGADLPRLAAHLSRRGRPVDLLARRGL
jgi:FkbM family methyltransferase